MSENSDKRDTKSKKNNGKKTFSQNGRPVKNRRNPKPKEDAVPEVLDTVKGIETSKPTEGERLPVIDAASAEQPKKKVETTELKKDIVVDNKLDETDRSKEGSSNIKKSKEGSYKDRFRKEVDAYSERVDNDLLTEKEKEFIAYMKSTDLSKRKKTALTVFNSVKLPLRNRIMVKVTDNIFKYDFKTSLNVILCALFNGETVVSGPFRPDVVERLVDTGIAVTVLPNDCNLTNEGRDFGTRDHKYLSYIMDQMSRAKFEGISIY
jgi:hypothetical protein